MKKVFLGLIAAGLMTTSANAWWINGGTISLVTANQVGLLVKTELNGSAWQYILNPTKNTKEMYATALTAQAGAKKVNVEVVGSYINSISVSK